MVQSGTQPASSNSDVYMTRTALCIFLFFCFFQMNGLVYPYSVVIRFRSEQYHKKSTVKIAISTGHQWFSCFTNLARNCFNHAVIKVIIECIPVALLLYMFYLIDSSLKSVFILNNVQRLKHFFQYF